MLRFPSYSYQSPEPPFAPSLQQGRAECDDEYRWLEAVDSDDALAWVESQNRHTLESMQDDVFFSVERQLREILDADDRIPFVVKRGEHYYNFWQDAEHPRGLWRRTHWESYLQAFPEWEVLIDVDALNASEGENWVWHGASCLAPDAANLPWERALVALSRGGADADVTREFDLLSRAWVDGGFQRPEAKGGMGWIDRDSVYVYTDFGPGSLTESGYPRCIKQWRRGELLREAVSVFEADTQDLMAIALHDRTRGFERDFIHHVFAFYRQRLIERRPDGQLVPLDLPHSAEAEVHREWLLVTLREDWHVADSEDSTDSPATHHYVSGALLAIDYATFKRGGRDFTTLFTPDAQRSLAGFVWTRHCLVLDVFEDVKHRLQVLTPGQGGDWSPRALGGLPDAGDISVGAVDEEHSDDIFLTVTDFLTPTTLMRFDLARTESAYEEAPQPIKQAPAFFDAKGMRAEQRFATSLDGTRIPYFIVLPSTLNSVDVSHETPHAPLPTLLNGYGGFEIPMTPHYIAGAGRSWLARGGAYVVANIRGGGEYGPRWHRAALKSQRHKAFEDFAAVAEDLVATGVTTPSQLGIRGGSNGGLLVGNMITHYPQLFAAAVCEVPLLDMGRYHQLLAGASWMAEYGDPDSQDWDDFLKDYSPYHNLHADMDYPAVLFTTSTRDDRVHPGHARKMMAKMQAMGCDVRYYENTEGGHGGAADNAQRARVAALAWQFLWQQVGGVYASVPKRQPSW